MVDLSLNKSINILISRENDLYNFQNVIWNIVWGRVLTLWSIYFAQITYFLLQDLAQQTKEKLNKGEETNKHHAGNTECGRIRTMDLKFNNSRKYVSITVPSKTQAMSPHIKSIDDIVVLGINLSRFNKLTQFFICVAGVFVFYLIYGYLQVNKLIISFYCVHML